MSEATRLPAGPGRPAAWKAACLLAAGWLAVGGAAGGEEVLIRARQVHLGDGSVLSPGAVLISDGKIVEVAESLTAPEGAESVEVDTLLPGLVDAHAPTAGLVADAAEFTQEVTPDFSVLDGVNWSAHGFRERLAEGVTSLHLAPSSENVFGGRAALVKSAGEPGQRVVVEKGALVLSLCADPAERNRSRTRPDSIYVRQPTNRMGVVWIVRNEFHKARQATAAEEDSLSPGRRSLQQALAGELPVLSLSRTHYDIRTLFRIADEFDIQPVVLGGEEAWRIVDELKQRKTAVVLGPLRPGQERGPERTRLCATTAQKLTDAGIPTAFSGRDLLDQARFAAHFGMNPQQALQAVTSVPAAILGQQQRIGSIAAGRDADLVAMQGPPLEFTSRVQWVMVDGKIHLAEADPQ